MSKIYDNWEKLVGAVLKREQFRQIAFSHSRDSSSISDESSSFSFNSSYRFDHQLVVYKGQSYQSLVPNYDAMDDGSIPGRVFFPRDHRETASRSVPGKVIFLTVEARELIIWTRDPPERQLPYSNRFTDAVEVNSVLSLDIRGKIKTRLLTSKTIYGAYLAFKSDDKLVGFESAKAMIRFVNDETDVDAERRADIVHLQPVDERKGAMAVKRADGWMEVQLGNFYVDESDDEEVEARLMETSHLKTGLIIEGIEFRPLVSVKQL